MQLYTKRCEIRNFTGQEEAQLHALLSSPAVMAHLEPPYSREQTHSFLLRCGLSSPPLIYGVWGRGNGKFLGYLIFHPWQENAWELGWVLAEQYWGIGIARELTREMIAYARSRHLGQLVLECVPEQTATQAIAEHFGFSPGEYRDGSLIFRLNL